MPEDFSELQTLLRLKRHETPPPGYLEDFLTEFHRRQRAELLRRPLWRIAFDRLGNLVPTLPTLPVPNLAYAGVSAVALIAAVGLLSRQPTVFAPPAVAASGRPTVTTPVSATVLPAAVAPVSRGRTTMDDNEPSFAAPVAAVQIAPETEGDLPFGDVAMPPAFVAPPFRTAAFPSAARPRYLLDSRPVRYEPSRSPSF